MYGETYYVNFDGMEGFSLIEGQVQIGLSMVIKDAEGNTILDENDLFGDERSSAWISASTELLVE